MSFDLNVLVLEQDRASSLPFVSSIDVVNEFQEALRYKDIWGYMTAMRGVWYYLGQDEDGWFNSLAIVDSEFENSADNGLIPRWLADDEDVRSNLTPLIVKEDNDDQFREVLKFLIRESPIKTIMFLARYQGGEKEIVCGVLKYAEFERMLNQHKILFNVCYIISE